jgi:hypothetical protein
MEVWALEAYGAAYILQELLTVKSDDVEGRTKIYESMVKGTNSSRPACPSRSTCSATSSGPGPEHRPGEEGSPAAACSESGALDMAGAGRGHRCRNAARSRAFIGSDSHRLNPTWLKPSTNDQRLRAVKIKLASPNDIRAWSYGEVKKPETINYRTYRPEKDGLFCERIFGPERTGSAPAASTGHQVQGHHLRPLRREGHPQPRPPQADGPHQPGRAGRPHLVLQGDAQSRLGNLLGMKTSDLEKVIYFQDYVVIDPGDTELTYKQLLTEDEYRRPSSSTATPSRPTWAPRRSAKLLMASTSTRSPRSSARSSTRPARKQKIKDLIKRLKIVERSATQREPTPSGWSWT